VNTNLLTVLNQITAQYGEDVLADPARLRAFLSDLAKDEPKPLRLAFGRSLEAGAYTALKHEPDAAERALRKTAIAQRVRDEHGLDPVLCAEAMDILEAVLFGEAAPRNLCKSCGKELQEGWKMCPHCGTACGTAERPLQSAPLQSPPVQAPPAVVPAAPVTPPKPAAPSAPPASAKREHTLRNVLITAGLAAAVIAGVIVFQQHPVPAMVRIEGGTFTMGSPANEAERFDDEEVQHQVTVSTFYMGKYEVTQKEWREVMGNNPSRFQGDNLPVEQVSWYEAVEYCNKRSQREGLTPAYTINGTNVSWNRNANGYRLPTEAEWEYACRAGTSGPFNMGNNISTNQANYDGNYPYNNNAKGTYREKMVNVGSFTANGWGLYDMHGNVWEWCWDWYGDYPRGAQTDPAGAASGAYRVERGGSWSYDAQYLRSAYRLDYAPTDRIDDLGFRLVRP
jgi:formylglycine-generating enzyme required for sulfatase activity